MTLGQFLIDQLRNYGAEHIFGIPGDYTLNFIKEVENNPNMEYVGVSREDSAGYASDAYARLKGCGVLCVTYSVGSMNVMNAIAGAYAERSPVVLITGKPTTEDLESNPYKHHTINNAQTQKDIFQNITCSSMTLDSNDMIENMIMIYMGLQAMQFASRPIYIEFSNKDIIKEISDKEFFAFKKLSEPKISYYVGDINEPIAIFEDIFTKAKNRILIVGHEVFRNSLENDVLSFANRVNIPIFTSLLGKSTIDEKDPLSLGCLSELCIDPSVIEKIKASDCIITIGMSNTDVDGFTFMPHISINMDEGTKINNKLISTPNFTDMVKVFCKEFESTSPQTYKNLSEWYKVIEKYKSKQRCSIQPEHKLSLEFIFNNISKSLNDTHIVISDIGESLFGMVNVPVSQGQFMCMAYYTSMGFSIPGAVGVKFAKSNKRPIIIIGDGAFQMASTEISSFVRYGMNPIIIILNNKGYSTERAIMDGKFNDIHNWNYHKITRLMGGGVGELVERADDFKSSLTRAINATDTMFVLNVQVDPKDMSPVMKSIANKMCKEKL